MVREITLISSTALDTTLRSVDGICRVDVLRKCIVPRSRCAIYLGHFSLGRIEGPRPRIPQAEILLLLSQGLHSVNDLN